MSEDNLSFKMEDIKIEEEKSFIKKYKKYSFLSLLFYILKKTPGIIKGIIIGSAATISSVGFVYFVSYVKEKNFTSMTKEHDHRNIVKEEIATPIVKEEIAAPIIKEEIKKENFIIHTMDGKKISGIFIKEDSENLFLLVGDKKIIVSKEEVYKTTVK